MPVQPIKGWSTKCSEIKSKKNVEVYVDDMLVKSQKAVGHLVDLEETFNTLRRFQMKLNPAKCTFGISSGKFLGFMVSN